MNDYVDRMTRALAYLEGRLRGKATLQGAAEAACLSSYHFDRVFRAMTGEAPLAYLRKRRLSAAYDEILGTDRRAIDIGLDFGYESAAAFSRAFSAQFGIAPSRLRSRRKRSISGYAPPMDAERLAHRMKGGIVMKARIEERGMLRLVGMSCENTAKKNGIPALWGKFIRRALREPGLLAGGTYGVYIYDFSMEKSQAAEDTAFTYLAACERAGSGAPRGMVSREIPARTYAVFEHRGMLAEIGKSYEYIYGTWFPESGLVSAAAEHFEYHGPDFKGDLPDSTTEIWIPLAAASPAGPYGPDGPDGASRPAPARPGA